jgi:translocation and assembly module TamB
MDIDFDFSNARLAMLPALSKMIALGEGDIHGNLSLEGTLEDPLVFGKLEIPEGRVKIADVDTIIDKIHADVEFKGRNVVLNDLSAVLGKGKVVANGSYALLEDTDEPYSLKVIAENAELASEIFSGIINSNIEILPQEYRDMSRKQGNLPAPLAHRPLIKGAVKLDDVLINMPTIPEMSEEESSNYGMDLKIELGDKVHLFNKYLYDIWLSGDMHIKGSTVFPVIEGRINADKGSITYLRTPFKLKNTSINWLTPGSFLPNVNLESEARFSRYDIYMRVTGPLEEMDLQLSSTPPLKRDTIVRMLTLQRDTAGSDDVTSEDMQNLMTAGLQMTVLGDVEMLLKQTLGLDQFRIYTGKVRSGIGFESAKDRKQELTPDERSQYNLLLSKYLGSRFMAGYTTSFDGIDRSIFGQYDINRRLNVTYSRSYDLSDKAEDWFGLEYKVGFN